MSDLVVPKRFLTDIYMGDEGPFAGRRAGRCPCGEGYEEFESVIVVVGEDDLTLYHEHCIPVVRMDDA